MRGRPCTEETLGNPGWLGSHPIKPAVCIFVHRFPVLSETFVALEASALAALGHRVSVEARRRSGDSSALMPEGVTVSWVEDETRPERLRALLWLIARHPLRALADVRGQRARVGRRGVPLRQLAPRARRLARLTPDVHLHTHFATVDADEAHRIARVIGAPTSLTAHAYDIYLRPDTPAPSASGAATSRPRAASTRSPICARSPGPITRGRSSSRSWASTRRRSALRPAARWPSRGRRWAGWSRRRASSTSCAPRRACPT